MLSISGWLCMVIVIFLLMAGSRWLCLERKQAFLYGILFFCTRDMGRLITESLYYLFNGKIVQGLDNENMIYRNVAADKRNETFLRAGSCYQQMVGPLNL